MITKENKDKAISRLARSKKDVGSPEVQVSILTDRIKEVTGRIYGDHILPSYTISSMQITA